MSLIIFLSNNYKVVFSKSIVCKHWLSACCITAEFHTECRLNINKNIPLTVHCCLWNRNWVKCSWIKELVNFVLYSSSMPKITPAETVQHNYIQEIQYDFLVKKPTIVSLEVFNDHLSIIDKLAPNVWFIFQKTFTADLKCLLNEHNSFSLKPLES